MQSTLHLSLLVATVTACLAVAMPAPAADASGHDHSGARARNRPALALGVAAAPDGALWIAGVDDAGRLFLQSTLDAGAHWSAPRVLDIAGDVVAAEGESRPAMAFGPGGAVVVTYTQPLSRPYTGNIRLLRSEDGGRSFSRPVTLHDDRQEITHRFASMAFDRHGELTVVWIDKRDVVKGYDGAAVYGKSSQDGGRHFGPDRKLADHSCECCRIALAEQPATGLVALWRHVFPGNLRDHAFAPLSDLGQGRAPVHATDDQWVIAACPHHGPGLAAAADGGFHAVWFSLRPGHGGVQYAQLTANGVRVGPARDLPDEGAEHADVAAAGHHVAVVWRSFDGEKTRLRAWTSADDGTHFALRELSATPGESDHPRLLRNGDHLQVVWRTESHIEVYDVDP